MVRPHAGDAGHILTSETEFDDIFRGGVTPVVQHCRASKISNPKLWTSTKEGTAGDVRL